MRLVLLIGACVAAYFLIFLPAAVWLGRHLRRQQPHNHPPEGGNHS